MVDEKNNDLMDYMSSKGYMADFIRKISDWQAFQNREDLDEFLMMIPEEYMSDYTEHITAYRGMLLDRNKLRDQIMCSWSTSRTKADYFSKLITEDHKVGTNDLRRYYSQVYEKTGEFFMLYKLIDDLVCWIKEKMGMIVDEISAFIEDVETAEDLIAYIDYENEVLGDFNKDRDKLVYEDKMTMTWVDF